MSKSKAVYNLTRIKIWYGVLSLIIPISAIVFVNWIDVLLIFSVTFLVLLAVHIADDIYGFKSGTDILNQQQKEDLKEPKPLVAKQLSLKFAYGLMVLLLVLALVCGILLVITHGIILLVLGGFTVFYGYSYSGPPFKLSYRGLGETVLIICTGLMPVMIAYYVFTHTINVWMCFIGLGLGLIFGSVLTCSNMADIEGDLAVKRKTLTVKIYKRWSTEAVLLGHKLIMLIGIALLTVGSILFISSPYSLIFLGLGVVFFIIALKGIEKHKHDNVKGRRFTFQFYKSICVIFAVTLIVWRLIY
jgi:1,4-dihydroxy-2-naphthoate octaprenyltransferase